MTVDQCFTRILGTGLLALFAAIGCEAERPDLGAGGASFGAAGFRLESYCYQDGLEPSLRHTFVIVDGASLVGSVSAEEFIANNRSLRDVLVGLGDVERAVASGMLDERERLTLLLAPENGSAPIQLFTGCAPALSEEEQRLARKAESSLARFFTGGQLQALSVEAERFQTRIVAAAALAAQEKAAGTHETLSPPATTLAEAGLMRSLSAAGGLISAGEAVPRFFLVTDLSSLNPPRDIAEARAAGFNEGWFTQGGDLGRVDVMVVGPGGGDEVRRAYLSAFLMARHARLISWSEVLPATLPAVPVRLERFAGVARYPESEEVVQIRLAADQNGRLVNSWITLRGLPDRSTPLTGQLVCSEASVCVARSDNGGFAQVWAWRQQTAGADFEPFDINLPFSGLRDWQFTLAEGTIEGAISDAAIDQIGTEPGNDEIPFSLVRQAEADF